MDHKKLSVEIPEGSTVVQCVDGTVFQRGFWQGILR